MDSENEGEELHPELTPNANGTTKWKMELNAGVAPGIGLPQSQVVDTGG